MALLAGLAGDAGDAGDAGVVGGGMAAASASPVRVADERRPFATGGLEVTALAAAMTSTFGPGGCDGGSQ